ncbi:phage baseplate assembly protein V [Orbaceae bacterium ESL0721]|nr:phage baseplate assembly protein V [Orbaceae bacterium ESL0721]
MFNQLFNQPFNQLKRKIQLLVSRAVVNMVTDTLKQQNLQVTLLANEVADDVERFQNYGHTSVPPAGSEAIVLSVGGKRQHLVAVAVDSKSVRMKNLKGGDSALYHLEGHHFLLTSEQLATLCCSQFQTKAQTAILFDSPQTQFTGNVDIMGGNSSATGTSSASDHVSGGISFLNHVHICPKCGSTTSTPQ